MVAGRPAPQPAPKMVAPEPRGAIVVKTAPPICRREVVPAAPSRDHVWIAGHWYWQGNNWTWLSGHYVTKPHGKARWAAARWDKQGDRWHYVPGCWM